VTSTTAGPTTGTGTGSTGSTQSGGGAGGAGQGGGEGGGGQGGEGGGGGQGGGATAPELYVSTNPAGRDADAILRLPEPLEAPDATLAGFGDITSLQNAAIDGAGDGWLSFDRSDGTGGLMFVAGLASRASGALGGGTRRIEGPATELLTPKGVKVVASLGIVLVADTGARAILAFDIDAEGDAAPLFAVEDLGGNMRAAWDIAYDEDSDTLFAACTDGLVLAYDDFSGDSGQGGPSRTITPAVNGAKISVNLHGIAFVDTLLDPAVLVLTDVGDPALADDGQLFTVANPGGASGITNVRARIAGPSSLLGNPVDLEVDGGNVYVAEKSNDRLLRFDGIPGRTSSGDTAPSASAVFTKPESVVVRTPILFADIFAVGNPAGSDADVFVRHDSTFAAQATLGSVGVLQSLESLALAPDGGSFATVDIEGGRGAIVHFSGLGAAADGDALGSGERRIAGDATGLIAPKGLRVADLGGATVVLVADAGAPARDIKVFAADAEGDAAPLFVIADLGADRAPWDLDYDEAADRLFVACTDGALVVFDDVSVDMGASGPSRTVSPAAAGVDIAVNLHGVQYLADLDMVVLSDVGDAGVATDGQVFTVAAASTAEGLTDVVARIRGEATLLGNPVDLVVHEGALYVAEKSNDRLLRFDAVADLSGEITAAPDGELAVAKPESVFLYAP
jgi:hypothetical protein